MLSFYHVTRRTGLYELVMGRYRYCKSNKPRVVFIAGAGIFDPPIVCSWWIVASLGRYGGLRALPAGQTDDKWAKTRT